MSSEVVVRGGRSMTPSKHAESEKIRARVLRLRDEMAEGYFEMGRLLYRVSKEQLYRQWNAPNGEPYEKFRDYVEHEVDFAFRKAKHLMAIWWWFAEELGDPTVSERIREIGWTKASMLVGIVDGKNVDKWIEKARTLGVKQLGDECKMALEAADKSRRPSRGGGVEPKPKPATTLTGEPSTTGAPLPMPTPASGAPERTRMGVDPLNDDEARDHRSRWTIIMDGEQRNNVEFAIDRASEIAEVEADGKGFLLDFMATAFLAMHGGTVGSSRKEHQANFRNELLRSAEKILGLDLVAFDRKTMRPLFGEQTIDRILEEES
jgi:hypothetical protein